jgi:L-rhamnose-H+ transport protein
MDQQQIWGAILVVLAGLCMGSSGWPIKLMRTFEYQQFGFISSLSWLAIIWGITLAFCPHAIEAYRSVDPGVLLRSNLFSMLWGVANVLFLMCMVRIGFSLTGGILTGLGVSVGVIMPFVFKGSGLFHGAPDLDSPAGYAVMAGVAVMLLGVVLVSKAGYARHAATAGAETSTKPKAGFGLGLFMAALAGVLSAGISFSFVYSQGPIVAAMKAQGAGDIAANIAVWAVGLAAGFLINILYPAWLMTSRKGWGKLWRSPREIALSFIIAAGMSLAIILLGQGMIWLGALGASIGFGVQQAMQMLGGQSVGFISGEWRDVPRGPVLTMVVAIVLLILAAVIMAYGNSLAH